MKLIKKLLFSSALSIFFLLFPQTILAINFDGIYTGFAQPSQISQTIPVKVSIENSKLKGPLIKEFNFALSENNIEIGIRFDMLGNVEENGLIKGTVDGQAEVKGNGGKTYLIGYKGSLNGEIKDKTLNFSVHVNPTTTDCPVSIDGKESNVRCSISSIDIAGKLEKSGEVNELVIPTVREFEKYDWTMPKISKVMGEVQIEDRNYQPGVFDAFKTIIFRSPIPHKWDEANKGKELKIKDNISTGNGRAIIEFSDGAKFLIRENTQLTVTDGGFKIDNGKVLMEFRKQKGGQIILISKYGKFGVVGTKFSLEATNDATLLTVFEGVVSAQTGDGKIKKNIEKDQSVLVSNKSIDNNIVNIADENKQWEAINLEVITSQQAQESTSLLIPNIVIGFVLGVLLIVSLIVIFRNLIIGIILLVISIGISAFLLGNQMSKPSKEKSEVNEEKLPTATPPLITTTPNPSPTKQIPLNTDKTDWQTYINNKLGFSIKHPKIIKPEEMDNQSVVFQFWGPTQSNDTEFYDGINIAFEKRTTGGKTLAAVVDEYYKGSKEIWGDKEVGEISSTTFGGFSGYTYKVPEHEYFYLGIDGQNYLEILNLSGDPGNLGYIKISQEMLKTFRKI